MKKIIFYLLALGLFISCNDDLIHEQNNNKENLNLIEIPQFSSQASFANAIKNYKENGSLPGTLKSGFPNQELTNDTSWSADPDSLIYCDELRPFLSKKNEIIVGNVYFIINKYGTFFTELKNKNTLLSHLQNEYIYLNATPIEDALGYKSMGDLYHLDSDIELYAFDTYNYNKSFINDDATVAEDNLKSSYIPNKNFIDIDIKGKTGKKLVGFKYERHIHWDKKHRLNIKFYAANFGVYYQVGVKTKTQKRGWTGGWRKQKCTEIVNGWSIFNLKEKWSADYFGPEFNPNRTYLPAYNTNPIHFKDIQYNHSTFAKKNWKTFHIYGADVDFSQKDKLYGMWLSLKWAGKTTVECANNVLKNPKQSKDAIRVIPSLVGARETRVSLAPYEQRKTNTDKHTLIISDDLNFEIRVKFEGGTMGYPEPKIRNTKATIEKGTIFYGGAKRGNTWKAVRIHFK